MSQKTKHRLAQVLKDNLRSQSVEKITISDLTDGCGINRKTFYYHFRDIYDLVKWAIEEDFRDAWGSNNTYESWHSGFLGILKRAQNDDRFIISAFPNLDRDFIRNCLIEPFRAVMDTAISSKTVEMDMDAEDHSLIINFCCHAAVGITMEWLEESPRREPEYIAGVVSDIFYSALPGTLEALRMDKPRRRRVYPII